MLDTTVQIEWKGECDQYNFSIDRGEDMKASVSNEILRVMCTNKDKYGIPEYCEFFLCDFVEIMSGTYVGQIGFGVNLETDDETGWRVHGEVKVWPKMQHTMSPLVNLVARYDDFGKDKYSVVSLPYDLFNLKDVPSMMEYLLAKMAEELGANGTVLTVGDIYLTGGSYLKYRVEVKRYSYVAEKFFGKSIFIDVDISILNGLNA